MGLFDWFRRDPLPAVPEQKNETLNRLLDYVAGSATSEAGVVVNENTALRVSAALACVSLIANDVATLPVLIKRDRGDGRVDVERVPAIARLLRQPNDLHSGFEFRQMMTAQAVLRGNAYAFKARNAAGRIVQLWPLMASEVQPRREGFKLIYEVSAYEGRLTGQYDQQSIFHLRGLMWDGIAGLNRLTTGVNALGLLTG
jgi:Phage-related protein